CFSNCLAIIRFSSKLCHLAARTSLGRRISNQNQTLKVMSHTPDLTKQPPRSPRVRLGGYVILPRCLDKGRATIAGKNGEYHYACPLDERFLNFVGINPAAMKKEL